MAKLYFRYGTVSSAKTLNLLAVAHNYRQQGKNVLLVKPAIDTRTDPHMIRTRAGLEMPADILAPNDGLIPIPSIDHLACILVDEAQFLPPIAVEQLYRMAHVAASPTTAGLGVPVICYGLRTDFRQQLFPASKRLLELADSIEEVKTTCYHCSRKATFNLKLRDGLPTLEGPVIELGFEETYLPVCADCYMNRHSANA
jgi:thymidine kinase